METMHKQPSEAKFEVQPCNIAATWSGILTGDATPISQGRVWVDGCFDLTHYGHFRAILLAKKLGGFLAVGVHTDEEISRTKGPTVLTLRERVAAIASCRWPSLIVPSAPYETNAQWLDHFGAAFAIHGDDPVIDKQGNDFLSHIKEAGRFKEIKRKKGEKSISTTELIARILASSCSHHLSGSLTHHIKQLGALDPDGAAFMLERLNSLAKDGTGRETATSIWEFSFGPEEQGTLSTLIEGLPPSSEHPIIYERTREYDGQRPFVVMGLYDDATVNKFKGNSFPIANLFERILCLIQCQYVNAVLASAPLRPTAEILSLVPIPQIQAIYHHPVTFMRSDFDNRYERIKKSVPFRCVQDQWSLNTGTEQIIGRVLERRLLLEERQKSKRDNP